MKMRYSGGSANAERITFLGATPTLIPWPDVPLALSSSAVDGIASTHESVASAKLRFNASVSANANITVAAH